MKRQLRILLVSPCAFLAFLALVPAAAGQTTQDVTFTWTPPTTGSPVDHYVVEHSVNGGPWVQIATVVSNSFTLAATLGDPHQIRVAGVDALDRQGPFSEPSDPYTPEQGPPGQPGQPIPIF
jgi:hypothetical protein